MCWFLGCLPPQTVHFLQDFNGIPDWEMQGCSGNALITTPLLPHPYYHAHVINPAADAPVIRPAASAPVIHPYCHAHVIHPYCQRPCQPPLLPRLCYPPHATNVLLCTLSPRLCSLSCCQRSLHRVIGAWPHVPCAVLPCHATPLLGHVFNPIHLSLLLPCNRARIWQGHRFNPIHLSLLLPCNRALQPCPYLVTVPVSGRECARQVRRAVVLRLRGRVSGY